MEVGMKKKVIIILVVFLLIVILVAGAVLILKKSPSEPSVSSDKFKDMVISNNLGEDSDFAQEKNQDDVSANIVKSIGIIKENLLLKADISNEDSSSIRDLINKSEDSAANNDLDQSLVYLKDAAAEANEAVNSYKVVVKKDLDSINSRVTTESLQVTTSFSLTNHSIADDWAVVTLDPGNNQVDFANIIMKKVDGEWTIFEGPSSAFLEEELAQKSVPQEIIERSNIIYYTNLLNPVI